MKTGYEYSRDLFDWCFENPHKINTNHIAIYFFALEHSNRLGWKETFGFPSQMVMEAVGIKNWRTYQNALNDLIEFGFIELIEKSKNQYSSNIIKFGCVKNTKANTKALDKALQKHSQKHSQSIDSINKQLTINNKQLTNFNFDFIKNEFLEFKTPLIEWINFKNIKNQIQVEKIYSHLIDISNKNIKLANEYVNFSIAGGFNTICKPFAKRNENDSPILDKLKKQYPEGKIIGYKFCVNNTLIYDLRTGKQMPVL